MNNIKWNDENTQTFGLDYPTLKGEFDTRDNRKMEAKQGTFGF